MFGGESLKRGTLRPTGAERALAHVRRSRALAVHSSSTRCPWGSMTIGLRRGWPVGALAASSSGGIIAADQPAARSVQVLFALRPCFDSPPGLDFRRFGPFQVGGLAMWDQHQLAKASFETLAAEPRRGFRFVRLIGNEKTDESGAAPFSTRHSIPSVGSRTLAARTNLASAQKSSCQRGLDRGDISPGL